MMDARGSLIWQYFHDGHSYRVILVLLGNLHGIKLSLRQLKRIIGNMGLRRRARISQSTLRCIIRVRIYLCRDKEVATFRNVLFCRQNFKDQVFS